jgi:hypothetical protein
LQQNFSFIHLISFADVNRASLFSSAATTADCVVVYFAANAAAGPFDRNPEEDYAKIASTPKPSPCRPLPLPIVLSQALTQRKYRLVLIPVL